MANPRGVRVAHRTPRGPVRGPSHHRSSPKGQHRAGHPFADTLKRLSPTATEASEGPTRRPRAEDESRAVAPEIPRERAHSRRSSDGSALENAGLEPFRAMPVLQPLPESAAPAPGSGLERAQAAAMAERLLHSVRVGQVDGGHEVRLTLAGAALEVRLRQQGDSLVPELHLREGATSADLAEAERLASRLDAELSRVGLVFDPIAIVR